jgi:hypothetical protein
VLLTYNYDDKDAKRLLRMHKSILCGATQINLKVLISDVHNMHLPRLADSGFFLNFLYQGGMMSTVSWVFADLKFKISEGYNPNWCFPDSAQLAVSGRVRKTPIWIRTF